MRSIAQITEYIIDEFLPDSDASELDNDLDLISSGIVDSLGFLRIVATLEHELDIAIEPEELDPVNFQSVRAISELIESKFTTNV